MRLRFGWSILRYVIRKAARSQGFLDPIELLGRMRGLAQPSEVGEPIELLRAGVVFHARGLINSKVIQHNLDWVWPYWAERQYNPRDPSFLPRAFSVTHVNLTQRNWTGFGIPGLNALPIVDPRGLLTPWLDGWSIDVWVLGDDGESLFPSRCPDSRQHLVLGESMAVTTRSASGSLSLETHADVVMGPEGPRCRLHAVGRSDGAGPARLVISARPQNPEGVSHIYRLEIAEDRRHWQINDERAVTLHTSPDQQLLSDYRSGDVLFKLRDNKGEGPDSVRCEAGLATAAAVYRFDAEVSAELDIPLRSAAEFSQTAAPPTRLDTAGEGSCTLSCPEPQYQQLYDAAVASLLLHSPDDVYPGPYTYRRFWFRDAAFIIHALLCVGLETRAREAIERFFDRQTALGYFRSQEGEWDSNGEVLWLLERYQQLTGTPVPAAWHDSIERAARWIDRKCLPDTPPSPHAGLLPAGFSAEHLGPNDYYYWDDFWGVGGLQAAAKLLEGPRPKAAERCRGDAERLQGAIDQSLAQCQDRLGRPSMPAAPYRRLDAGAIGSLVAGYPLGLQEPRDPRLVDCAEYLLEQCCIDGAFFQDMIHSGYNAYLTLHLAQVLLRADDPRYLELMDRVAEIASPTGQWPEAIHPLTGGGCMGDGHHVWAAAEWLLMIRALFVREENDGLTLCPGIPGRWLAARTTLRFGPTPTAFGPLSVSLTPVEESQWELTWEGKWHGQTTPAIHSALPGWQILAREEGRIRLGTGEAGEVGQ